MTDLFEDLVTKFQLAVQEEAVKLEIPTFKTGIRYSSVPERLAKGRTDVIGVELVVNDRRRLVSMTEIYHTVDMNLLARHHLTVLLES